MIIETQNTPDKNILNFFPPMQLVSSGRAEFVDTKSIRKSPLAEKIFDIEGIESLFITSELISVTKKENASWENLKPQILAEIMEHITLGEATIISSENTNEEVEETISKI